MQSKDPFIDSERLKRLERLFLIKLNIYLKTERGRQCSGLCLHMGI